jgi:hypothetical protein
MRNRVGVSSTGFICLGIWTSEYEILVEKPEGKRPLEKPRHR